MQEIPRHRAAFPRGPRQTLLFLRDFHAMTGGHLKVWHYFAHTAQSRHFVPKVYFTPGSRKDATNPWIVAGIVPEPEWRPEEAHALFIGGLDWQWVETQSSGSAGRPVLNIIQGLRHLDPQDPRHAYLSRPAVRISVNPIIGRALRESREVRGPVLDVPMGLDVAPPADPGLHGTGVVITALKNVRAGRDLEEKLAARGVPVRLLGDPLPRDRFLEAMSSAEVVVCIPHPTEGFYLPALEAMALGRTVVCPDCGGNRIYLRDGRNGLMPTPDPHAVAEATCKALGLDEAERARMRAAARQTAAQFTMDSERAAFFGILSGLDQLWRQCE